METIFNEAVSTTVATVADPTPSTDPDGFERVIGTSARLTQVVSKARVLAGVHAAVLLHGETGVGKEVFARALHEHGSHPRAPFVALNCGGLSRELLASELFGYVDGAFTGARRAGMIGKVEAANGGTLFLDEIAELPIDLQPFLLRVLEGGEVYPLGSNKPRRVRFRLIAACNRELPVEIKAGRFRMDLFYRISVTSLHIPPLRERTEDLPALVEHFAEGVAQRHGTRPKRFSNEVLEAFASYSWPGNLRELRNVVEGMMLLSDDDTVGLSALPLDLLAPVPAPLNAPVPETANANAHAPLRGLREAEREAIESAIGAHAGNLTLVARGLGISRSTLYLKLKKYGLEHSLNHARSNLS